MSRTILIMDDDAGARTVLRCMLEPEGYDVVLADSGEQAIALASTLQVDAFLLDLEMPQMDGTDVCRALRSMDGYRTVPLFFLLANPATLFRSKHSVAAAMIFW